MNRSTIHGIRRSTKFISPYWMLRKNTPPLGVEREHVAERSSTPRKSRPESSAQRWSVSLQRRRVQIQLRNRNELDADEPFFQCVEKLARVADDHHAGVGAEVLGRELADVGGADLFNRRDVG